MPARAPNAIEDCWNQRCNGVPRLVFRHAGRRSPSAKMAGNSLRRIVPRIYSMSLPKALDARSTVFLIRNPRGFTYGLCRISRVFVKSDRIYNVICRRPRRNAGLISESVIFTCANGDGQAGLVVLRNLTSELESPAQFEFRVAIVIESERGKPSSEEKSVSRKTDPRREFHPCSCVVKPPPMS